MLMVIAMDKNQTIEEQIIEIINKLKPFLNSDGGDIEFVKYEDGIVYIRMTGACANCELIDVTLNEGVEYALKEAIPEVTNVINIK